MADGLPGNKGTVFGIQADLQHERCLALTRQIARIMERSNGRETGRPVNVCSARTVRTRLHRPHAKPMPCVSKAALRVSITSPDLHFTNFLAGHA